MNDTDKKMLTEWMGECWHYFVNDMKCLDSRCRYCHKWKSTSPNRTFTTWQDLGDVKEKLVEKGLWGEFLQYATRGYFSIPLISRLFISTPADLAAWLVRPVDEKGDPHFCGLVAKFKPWEKEAGI